MQAGHAGLTSRELCEGAEAAAAPTLQPVSAPGDEGSDSHCSISEGGLVSHSQQLLQIQQLLRVPAGKRGGGRCGREGSQGSSS